MEQTHQDLPGTTAVKYYYHQRKTIFYACNQCQQIVYSKKDLQHHKYTEHAY